MKGHVYIIILCMEATVYKRIKRLLYINSGINVWQLYWNDNMRVHVTQMGVNYAFLFITAMSHNK